MGGPKEWRAQETRWRFLSVHGRNGKFYNLELSSRTSAREFAVWLIETGECFKVDLRDKNGLDGGEGWADPRGSS